MLMGKNILIFEEHRAQEHIACWSSGNTSDCSHLKNRLEKCWCFGCSELFLEQFDRVTSWEVWSLWVCIFHFRTALTLEARVKEQVLKGGQSNGQSVIKSVIKSCSQMLLSVPKFFMYVYLEDVSFNGLMTLQGADWVSAMKLVVSFLTCLPVSRTGGLVLVFQRRCSEFLLPKLPASGEKYYCRSLCCVRSYYF